MAVEVILMNDSATVSERADSMSTDSTVTGSIFTDPRRYLDPDSWHRTAAWLRQGGGKLKTLIHMDGPEHHSYRAVTNDWFKPGNLRRRVEARVAELARKYVDQMMELGGECDFARQIARFYPLQVIMSILGVPENDEPLMLELTQNLLGAEDPDLRAGLDRAQSTNNSVAKFAEYFGQVTAARRANATGDLASTIANG